MKSFNAVTLYLFPNGLLRFLIHRLLEGDRLDG